MKKSNNKNLPSENEIRTLIELANEIEPALLEFFAGLDRSDSENEQFFAEETEFDGRFEREEPIEQFDPNLSNDFPLMDIYLETVSFSQKFIERLYYDCSLPPVDRKLNLSESLRKYIWSEVSPLHFENLKYFSSAELKARKILLFRQIFLFLSQINQMFADEKSSIEVTKLIDSEQYFENSLGLQKYLQYVTRSEINCEIKSFIHKIAALQQIRLILPPKNPKINGLDAINLISEIQWETIKKCPVCAKFFLAKRKDAQTCSANCSSIFRQRQWYKRQKS